MLSELIESKGKGNTEIKHYVFKTGEIRFERLKRAMPFLDDKILRDLEVLDNNKYYAARGRGGGKKWQLAAYVTYGDGLRVFVLFNSKKNVVKLNRKPETNYNALFTMYSKEIGWNETGYFE